MPRREETKNTKKFYNRQTLISSLMRAVEKSNISFDSLCTTFPPLHFRLHFCDPGAPEFDLRLPARFFKKKYDESSLPTVKNDPRFTQDKCYGGDESDAF